MIDSLGVVESGDGYIRFGSGIQMCWGTQTFTNIEVNNSYGSVYRSNDTAIKFDDFPVSFSSLPMISYTGYLFGTTFWLGTSPSNGQSTTSPGYPCVMRGNSSTISPTLSYFAIGKWK